ncbi:AAA family ATPase [Thioflexithrix psekupsensis]|uniref:Endonuclease GajA/Old nuclease/RecF-like AAA domain-containing protein n=1 Tax=Thioflexithrix psekupsensis TaxID=1570016 RepID=A0A251XC09_9GAMM|nr:AAA family ATPase [Thioflexithrix psekupsensis]OUD16194.1 hypothetical protein TPSD3_00255 [Thioflexithrix psekupsensis]
MAYFFEIQDLLESQQPLPKNVVRVYVLGKTGSGKTTFIREIMGTEQDNFPVTGKSRTTTVPTEYILHEGAEYKATVVFKEKEEILDAIHDVLVEVTTELPTTENGAISEIESEEKIKKIVELISETPCQTTRFSYILSHQQLQEMAKEIYAEMLIPNSDVKVLIKSKKEKMYDWINESVKQICHCDLSMGFYSYQRDNKADFIEISKKLLSNQENSLIPLLSYIRIEGKLLAGPFLQKNESIILIDSEGIGHNLNALSNKHFDFLNVADYVFLIEEADQPFISTSSALKEIFEKGYLDKFKFIFNKANADAESKKQVEKAIRNFSVKDRKKITAASFFLSDKAIPDANLASEIAELLEQIPLEVGKFINTYCDCSNIDKIFSDASFSLNLLQEFLNKVKDSHWKKVDALNRRIVNKQEQYGELKPVYEFCNSIFNLFDFDAIIKFNQHVTKEEKEKRINKMKQDFFQQLSTYGRWLLLEQQRESWQAALEISGSDTKTKREEAIGKISDAITEHVKSREFKMRVTHSFNAICAADPRIKISAAGAVIKLEIKQYKIIKQAEVELAGLSVIAGENDTGKSTISKIFYNEITSAVSRANGLTRLRPKEQELYQDHFYPIFIGNPDLLDKFSYIKNTFLLAEQYGFKYDLPKTVIDLILRLASKETKQTSFSSELSNDIQHIIRGKLSYKEIADNIVYEKDLINEPISMFDTASGIKMFGVLQILIQNQSLKQGSILILDEPEIHVHPNWQLKYAELMIALVKQEVRVLLTTHSHYMVEALIRYAWKEKIADKIRLYLTEKEEQQSILRDVTNDKGRIFEQLSEPFAVFDALDIEEAFHG